MRTFFSTSIFERSANSVQYKPTYIACKLIGFKIESKKRERERSANEEKNVEIEMKPTHAGQTPPLNQYNKL